MYNITEQITIWYSINIFWQWHLEKKTKDTFGVGAKEWENDIHKSHTQKNQSKTKKTDLDHEVRWLEKSKLLSAG